MKKRILIVEDEDKLRRVLELQLVSAGKPEHAKFVTAPLKEFMGEMLIATVCDCPWGTMTCTEPGLREKSDTLIAMGAEEELL